MKNKLKEICNEYIEDANRMLDNFMNKVNLFIDLVKKDLNDPKVQKKYITMASILLVITILIANLFTSFAYYFNSTGFPIINAKVGNLYLNKYDYVLRIYLEDAKESGDSTYHLVNSIPNTGYEYRGYTCENNSTLVYDKGTKLTSVNLNSKDVCSIYFDLINKGDLFVNVMLEEKIGSDTYVLGKDIPIYGYKYSHYECSSGSDLEYDSERHKMIISASGKDTCNVYFKKEKADISLRLFIENTYKKGDYVEMIAVPSGKNYVLNSNKTICKNTNEERIENISYKDGYIETESSEIMACDVYLDLNE